MTLSPTSREFFEAKYRDDPDPWHFASAPAELFRYGRIVESLSHRRYRQAFEPACSVGVLTERIAPLCDRVLAFDLSQTASDAARSRCAHLSNVDIRCASLDDLLPAPETDLLLLSEVGYYYSAAAWEHLLARLLQAVLPGTTVLAAHWLGHSNDHRIGGDEVHRIVRASPLLHLDHEERHEHFRLDLLVRIPDKPVSA